MYRRILSALLTASLLTIEGCATVPHGAVVVDSANDLPTIQQANSDVLSKVKIGMPLADFHKLIPEAYVAGQNRDVTAYELDQTQKYVTKSDMKYQKWVVGFGSPNTRTSKQVLWFYFYKAQLVKWGRPQDWPENPEIIIKTISQ